MQMISSRGYQLGLNVFMALLALATVFPFILLVSGSLTSDTELLQTGYAIIPKEINFTAYEFLWNDAADIGRAYGITILVTLIGTAVGLTIIALLAYPLSRQEMPFRNFLAFFVFFTMLFNGGLVPTYLVYTNLFDVKNSLWALIVPGLLVNAFYVIIMRTFFATSIPGAIIESAYMDGAKEFRIFISIVLPLSTPVLATVGLFQTIHYWNDWFNGLIYITDSRFYSLQNMLNRILLDVQFLQTSQDNVASSITSDIPLKSMRMAMAAIGVIPIIIAYPFFQKYFIKGITIGAVKG
ncbi:carbohydrate ABC transporter permease [Paenibacillus endoradicis]|uniref:carbohydrate ABC transporter permease n=1 Tax=Paenibacillus endoradicis TaxID=2972487 RepID=UPI002159A199|nr:carbohydrate ABC transporter permease [Paenibacillus endoradicis]MCR8657687.1 carbohydrate ABC transporter permease [Paenibacillus endoradicis]